MHPLRTRIAPTPSGFLHLGNTISFVATWALARAQSGWVLLRIDDLDDARRRPEYLEDIFRTLDWLGIDYDAGPSGPDDFLQHYSQHLRLPLYHEALAQLKDKGLLYACVCSRREIQQLSADGRYPGTCSDLDHDFTKPETAWRIKLPRTAEICFEEWNKGQACVDLQTEMGDFVVKQKNELPAYQIASLADDRYWQINFIVRGEDLRSSTAAQMYLARQLNYHNFQNTIFWHHGLITDASGRKLSKSEGADAIKSWREAGKSPAELFRMAADWLGAGPLEKGDPTELITSLKRSLF